MVAAFGSAGTGLGGAASAAANFPVPATPAAGAGVYDIVFLYYEAALVDGTVTPSAGFTELTESPIEVIGSGQGFVLRIYGKLAAVDTGTYNFTLPFSTWREGVVIRLSGVDTTSPVDVTNISSNTGSVTTSTAVSDTSTGDGQLWVWAVSNYQAGTTTFGGSFTKRADTGEVAVATLAQASAGASGSLTATHSSACDAVWLGSFKPVAPPANTTRFFALF
jgi:hypothetical protein